MLEVKGKQNKPPIPKYMPAVIEFIQKNNITVASSSDLFNAGYVYDKSDGSILTIEEALQKYSKVLGKTEKGPSVVEVSSDIVNDVNLARLLRNYTSAAYTLQRGDVLYRLVSNNKTVATCVVNSKIVVNVWSPSIRNIYWDVASINDNISDLIDFLSQQGLVESLSDKVERDQPYLSLRTYDKNTRKFSRTQPTREETVSIDGQDLPVRTYEQAQGNAIGTHAIQQAKRQFGGELPGGAAESVTIIPSADDDSVTLMVKLDSGVLLPYSGSLRMFRDSYLPCDGSKLDTMIRTTVTKVANESESVLPLSYCAFAGIVKTAEGYEPIVPKPIAVTPSVSKFDLSELSEAEKFIMTSMAAGAKRDGRDWSFNNREGVDQRSPTSPYTTLVSTKKDSRKGSEAIEYMAPGYPSDKTMVALWNSLKQKRFRGESPFAFYFPSVASASRFVMAVDANKNVLSIDTLEDLRGQKDGSMRAQANRVAAMINEVIEAEGLKVSRHSTTGMSSFFSVDRSSNKIITNNDKTKLRLEDATDGDTADRQPRERAPRAAREGGGESKAARAAARFREMTAANGGQIPSRAEFIAVLRQEPFNMTPAGASTYYHNIKVKHAQANGQLGETFTFKEYLMCIA